MFHRLSDEERNAISEYLHYRFFSNFKNQKYAEDYSYTIKNRYTNPENLWFSSRRKKAKEKQLEILRLIDLNDSNSAIISLTNVKKTKKITVLKECLEIKIANLIKDEETQFDKIKYFDKQGAYHRAFMAKAIDNSQKNSEKFKVNLKIAETCEKLTEKLLPQTFWGWITGENKRREIFVSKLLSEENTQNEGKLEKILLEAFVLAANGEEIGETLKQNQEKIPAYIIEQILKSFEELEKLNNEQNQLLDILKGKVENNQIKPSLFSSFKKEKYLQQINSLKEKISSTETQHQFIGRTTNNSTSTTQEETPSITSTGENSTLPRPPIGGTPKSQEKGSDSTKYYKPDSSEEGLEVNCQRLEKGLSELLSMNFFAAATIGSGEVDPSLSTEAQVASVAANLLGFVPVAGDFLTAGAQAAIEEFDNRQNKEKAKKLVQSMGVSHINEKIRYFSKELANLLKAKLGGRTQKEIDNLAKVLIDQFKNSLYQREPASELPIKGWFVFATRGSSVGEITADELGTLGDFVTPEEKVQALEKTSQENRQTIHDCFKQIYQLAEKVLKLESKQEWLQNFILNGFQQLGHEIKSNTARVSNLESTSQLERLKQSNLIKNLDEIEAVLKKIQEKGYNIQSIIVEHERKKRLAQKIIDNFSSGRIDFSGAESELHTFQSNNQKYIEQSEDVIKLFNTYTTNLEKIGFTGIEVNYLNDTDINASLIPLSNAIQPADLTTIPIPNCFNTLSDLFWFFKQANEKLENANFQNSLEVNVKLVTVTSLNLRESNFETQPPALSSNNQLLNRSCTLFSSWTALGEESMTPAISVPTG